MTKKARFISNEEHQTASKIVEEKKAEEPVIRFLNGVMNGREVDPQDSLIVAYALLRAIKNSRGRNALGIKPKGRGKGEKTTFDPHYLKFGMQKEGSPDLASLALMFQAGIIDEESAHLEIRKYLEDDKDQKIDPRVIKERLEEICYGTQGLYNFLGKDGVLKLYGFKPAK